MTNKTAADIQPERTTYISGRHRATKTYNFCEIHRLIYPQKNVCVSQNPKLRGEPLLQIPTLPPRSTASHLFCLFTHLSYITSTNCAVTESFHHEKKDAANKIWVNWSADNWSVFVSLLPQTVCWGQKVVDVGRAVHIVVTPSGGIRVQYVTSGT